jgi:hypothetical protein
MDTGTRRRKVFDQAAELKKKLDAEKGEPATVGTLVTVTWGEETFSPVQYNSFRIGGHSVTLAVEEGETLLDTWKRGWAMLEEAAEIQFTDKVSGFADRIKRAKDGMRG